MGLFSKFAVIDRLSVGFDDHVSYTELVKGLLMPQGGAPADQYFLLADFESYLDAKLRVNRDYRDRYGFARKCLLNIAGCGMFSSDRAIKEYADEIWGIADRA